MEGVVAAQLREAVVPGDLVALAAGDRGAQVVVDALAGDAAEPLEGVDVALDERLDGHVEAEVGGRGAGVGQRADQGVDAALAAGDLRPGRHLGPVDLHHLGRSVAGPLRGALARRAELGEPLSDQVDRAL